MAADQPATAAACDHTDHRVNDRGERQGQIARTAWESCATAAQPLRCDHGKTPMEFCRRCDPFAAPRQWPWQRWWVYPVVAFAGTENEVATTIEPRWFARRSTADRFVRYMARFHFTCEVRRGR